jgi:hypothetical protein
LISPSPSSSARCPGPGPSRSGALGCIAIDVPHPGSSAGILT